MCMLGVGLMSSLPFSHATRDDSKERMWRRPSNRQALLGRRRAPVIELSHQVLPFVRKLARRLLQRTGHPCAAQLRTIKSIATAGCFFIHVREVGIDAGDRIPLLLKTMELGMVAISGSPPQQDRPSEKTLAPERD